MFSNFDGRHMQMALDKLQYLMLDSQMIPIARLLRFIRFDAPNIMRRAFHQLTDQATGLISDFTARGGWPGLEGLRLTGILSRIKLTH